MKCDICRKNEATVSYRESINGNERVYSLCPACAKEKEQEMSHAFAKMQKSFSGGLLDSFFAPRTVERSEKKRCDLCGSTFDIIAKQGRAGCPKCYSVFENEMLPLIRRLHSSASHTGRSPHSGEEPKKENETERLQRELRLAIEKEEYEAAAELRDKLRAIREREEG